MFEKYYTINEAVGININVRHDGSVGIDACGVAVKNNSLDIEKKVTGLKSVEELKDHFAGKQYVSVNLTGKGILYKQIEKVELINQNTFLQVFPNANHEDFYIQNFVSGSHSFVSVIRKTDADQWLLILAKQDFIPVLLSLGPFTIQHILPQLNVYGEYFVINGHTIQRDEQQTWKTYQFKESLKSTFPLKLESEGIDEQLVLPYAAAFQLVLSSKIEPVKAYAPAVDERFQQVIADRKLRMQASLILGGFFVLLLVNILTLTYLNASNTKLTKQVSRTAQSTNDIQGINEQVGNKELLLKNLGWDGGINKSVLIDQLSSLLPGDISFKEINVNPLDASTSRVQKTLTFMERKIKVIGFSQRIIPVNEWIARVKAQKWVKNIQMDSYAYNSELNTGQFTVLIDY